MSLHHAGKERRWTKLDKLATTKRSLQAEFSKYTSLEITRPRRYINCVVGLLPVCTIVTKCPPCPLYWKDWITCWLLVNVLTVDYRVFKALLTVFLVSNYLNIYDFPVFIHTRIPDVPYTRRCLMEKTKALIY